MGWLPVLISGLAAFLLFKTGHTVLMIFAIFVAICCFWTWGIMHNYATNAAKRRPNYSGKFFDLTNRDIQAVPDWLSMVSMLFSIGGLVLFIIGIIMMLTK